MKKIIGYRYQCPKCGYTYKLYNGGARPAADYLCPIHKVVMPAAAIEQGEDAMAPVVTPSARDTGWIPVTDRLPKDGVNPITLDAHVYPVTVDLGGVTDVRYYSYSRGHWAEDYGLYGVGLDGAAGTISTRMMEVRKLEQIKSDDRIGYADYLKIVFADKCVEVFLKNDRCLDFTFGEALQKAKENGWSEETILLIAENPLFGVIYQYGNYGGYWVRHGKTEGYA